MKRVLVTGAAGMIGSHLLDSLLEREYSVVGIDNLSYGKLENITHNVGHHRFKFYRVDILDFDTLKVLAKDIDIIVHLAAIKKVGEKQSSMDTLMVNAKGTEHILEVSKMWGCKVIFASTSDVYGMSSHIPFREDDDLLIGPSMIKRWSYAVSKLYGEQLTFAYYKDYNVPVVIIRYFGAFSPRSSFLWSGGHIPIFIDSILNDRELVIHGDGTQTRSMAYVTDVVEGTILAMENDTATGEIFNIGNDEEASVIDTAYMIHEIAHIGKELRLKFVPFEEVFGKGYKDIMRRLPDLSKAKNILHYSPKVDIRKAIELTIASIKNQKENAQ